MRTFGKDGVESVLKMYSKSQRIFFTLIFMLADIIQIFSHICSTVA
jgi:hypothetical protein